MTNLDALKAVVDLEGISANSYSKALIDVGVDPNSDYASGSKEVIDTAAVGVLENFLRQSISEGSYSVSFDRKAIEAKISGLRGDGKRGISVLNI